MTVVDASLLLDALLGGASSAVDAVDQAQGPLAAPELIDLEVAAGCRRLLAARSLTIREATEILRRLATIPLRRHSHMPLMPRVWQLREFLTPYDAAYVALAEGLDAPFLTRDASLARARGLRCDVRLIPA